MSSNLILHSGGWDATIEDLQAVAVPDATETYQPVPHDRLVQDVTHDLSRFGLRIERARYGLARDGKQMFGVLDLANGATEAGWRLALGMRNSYDRSFALGLAAGCNVFICDNLSFSGDVVSTRKHTQNILRELPSLIYGMLEQVVAHQSVIRGEIAAMQAREVNMVEADHVIVEALRNRVLPASTLPHLLKEWEEPSFDEFKPRTAWSLFNAFTWVMKQRSPRSQMEDTLRLNKVFGDTLLIPSNN